MSLDLTCKCFLLRSSCLDRTNVAQFSAGVEAMEQQLVVMGIRSNPKLDPSSNVVRVLIDMYVDIGDHIALQYGGSEAHKKVTVSLYTKNKWVLLVALLELFVLP